MENIERLSQMKRETNRMIEELSLLMEVSTTTTKHIISNTVDKFNVLLPGDYIVQEYQYTLKLLEQFNK